MHTSEWALVAFTILGQLAAGTFLVSVALQVRAGWNGGGEEAERLAAPALPAVATVLPVALAASILHLGNPSNAFWAIANLRQSWLSREILSAGLFAGGVAVLVAMRWLGIGSPAARRIAASAVAAAAILLVFAMSRLYMLPAVPAWNSAATPVSFFTTTLLLGVLATSALLVVRLAWLRGRGASQLELQRQLARRAMRGLAVAALVLLAAQLVAEPLRLAMLSNAGGAGARSARFVVEHFGLAFGARLGLVALGAGGFVLWIYRNRAEPAHERTTEKLVPTAFVLVLISETLARWLFYAMYRSIAL